MPTRAAVEVEACHGCGVLGEAVVCARSSPTGTASPRTPQPWHVLPLLWGPEEAGPPRLFLEERNAFGRGRHFDGLDDFILLRVND